MTGNVYKTPSAVIVLILDGVNGREKVLCQRRCNTDFGDGMLDFSYSGKVEEGETFIGTAIREGKEELNITIKPQSLKFMSLVHKHDDNGNITFVNVYFICTDYEGEIKIGEPDKCSELVWSDINNLPADLLDDRKQALLGYLNDNYYLEYGW